LSPAARAVPALVLSSRGDSPVAKIVSRALGRAVASADATRAGSWYKIG
jgi:hypothetical protein